MESSLFLGLLMLINILDGAVLHQDDIKLSDPLTKIDKKLNDLEAAVMRKAREVKQEMESKLWGLHDKLEKKVREVAHRVEHDCRKNALVYLSDALEEVEKNGQICSFAKTLAQKMKNILVEATQVVLKLRTEAQELKLKHIPCLDHNMAIPYCQKINLSLDRLSTPATDFTSQVSKYFSGDYDRFLQECFDKTAFEMKIQAGVVEARKCEGV